MELVKPRRRTQAVRGLDSPWGGWGFLFFFAPFFLCLGGFLLFSPLSPSGFFFFFWGLGAFLWGPPPRISESSDDRT